MKIFLVAILIIFLYLRKPVSRLWRNTKINYLLGLYNSYKHANGHDEKALAFEQIAKNRPLSNDLIGGLYFFSPSYDDFGNEEKLEMLILGFVKPLTITIIGLKILTS